MLTHTDRDFADLSWHDCALCAVEFRVGEPDEDDWTRDLALGIDFIVEWLCGADRSVTFKVAPAYLVFHDVSGPNLSLDWRKDRTHDYPTMHGIERAPAPPPTEGEPLSWSDWRIPFNWPAGGEISFFARGFTQTLLAEPILTKRQRLTRGERVRLLAEAKRP